jgi:hypothetical protein
MVRDSVKMVEAAKQAALDATPASFVPDGEEQTWYRRLGGFFQVWLWNLPFGGYKYHYDFFEKLLPDRSFTYYNVPMLITTQLTSIAETRTLRMTNADPEDNGYIIKPHMDHSFWYVATPENDLPAWKAVYWSSMVPFLFKDMPCDIAKGHVCIDGCATTGCSFEYLTGNVLVVTTYDNPSMEMDPPSKPNWAGLPIIGPFVKAYQHALGSITDNFYDSIMVWEGQVKKNKNNKEKALSIIKIPSSEIRRKKRLPSRFDLKACTRSISEELWESGIELAKKYVERMEAAEKESGSNHLDLMAQNGVSACLMGGACNMLIQAAVLAFLYDYLKERKEKLKAAGTKVPTERVFTAFTGESAGSINSLFFANLQQLDEAGKLHLVMKSS